MDDLMKEWLEANRDGKLTMNHPLDENSIVLDVGSYTGKWSLKLYDKYKCNIYSYEPVYKFAEEHKKNVGQKKIKVFNYALDVKDSKKEMFLQKDGTSFLINNNSDEKVLVQTKNASNVMKYFDYIDLVKMNIEGSEYDVIDDLYNSGLIKKPNRFMIQFHDAPNFEQKLSDCRNKLSESHNKLWGYGTIWELWEKK